MLSTVYKNIHSISVLERFVFLLHQHQNILSKGRLPVHPWCNHSTPFYLFISITIEMVSRRFTEPRAWNLIQNQLNVWSCISLFHSLNDLFIFHVHFLLGILLYRIYCDAFAQKPSLLLQHSTQAVRRLCLFGPRAQANIQRKTSLIIPVYPH